MAWGDLLGLGVQADHVRGEGAERDPGRDGRRGRVRFLELYELMLVSKFNQSAVVSRSTGADQSVRLGRREDFEISTASPIMDYVRR